MAGRKRLHMVDLPKGVHRVPRPSGKVEYWWRPGRGTRRASELKHQWCRLPDDPASSEFFRRIEQIRRGGAAGGVEAMVREYMASSAFEQIKPASRHSYAIYLRQFVKRFGKFDPGEIQAKHLAALRETMRREKPGAAAQMVRVVKLLFSWAAEMGLVTHNPMRDVSNRYKANPREPWPEEAIRAIDQMQGPARAACLLAYHTGQRISDICAMSREAVEKDEKTGITRIRVVQQKTGKPLLIRMHSKLALVVEAAETWLVGSAHGRALKPNTVRRMVQEELTRLGFDGLHFHGLRKSAVCTLLEEGCTEAQTAAVTGQSLGMVRYYAMQVNQQKLADEAIGKVDQ